MNPSKHIRNIAIDLILTIVTFGLYNIYVQSVQMDAVNDMLKQEKYSFWKWLLLTIITFGLYHIYHEYRLAEDIETSLHRPYAMSPVVCLILTLFGLHIVADAVQQARINAFYGDDSL